MEPIKYEYMSATWPGAKAFAASCFYNESIWIYGGYSGKLLEGGVSYSIMQTRFSSDLWRFSFSGVGWSWEAGLLNQPIVYPNLHVCKPFIFQQH